MQRTFVYRLKPTATQTAGFQRQLDACRHVYNNGLEHRREVYRATGRGPSRYDQEAELSACRKLPGWEILTEVHCHPLQDSLARLDRAFQAFFRRCAAGEAPGYPRFRSAARFDSFTFKAYGSGCEIRDGRLRVSKVGAVRIRQHRPLVGTPKTATLVRKADGWYAHIVCDLGDAPDLREGGEAVGIDVGVAVFATLSTGERIENPRHADAHRARVQRAQRVVSRRRRGSNRRRKAVMLLAQAKQAEARARRDFHHKVSRMIVDAYGLIAVEDLKVQNMVRSARGTLAEPGRNVAQKRGLNRSIQDAGWAQFIGMLVYKAEDAGSQLVKVDPRNMSRTCAECGVVDRASRRSQSSFRCVACGHVANADHNAAVNIKHRARARSVVEVASVAA